MTAKGWAVVGVLALVVTTGCAVQSEPRNDLSFSGTATVENGTFHLEGELELGRGAGSDQNYSDISVVLYDGNRSEIESVEVGRMSTNPGWGTTRRPITVTSGTVPTYVVVESPDFWKEGEIEVVALWIHGAADDGTYHRYARTGPDDETFPCEVNGLRVDASHCDRTSAVARHAGAGSSTESGVDISRLTSMVS